MGCKQTEFDLNHNNVGAPFITIIGASIRVAQQLSTIRGATIQPLKNHEL